MSALICLAALAGAAASPCRAEGPTGMVDGRITLVRRTSAGQEKVLTGADLSNVVAYLVPDGFELPPQPVPPAARMAQQGAKFLPAVVAVARGQAVEFPNNDEIKHNVFSFSKAKRFDLGLFEKGVKKSVVFDAPGVVAVFCSIHSNMAGFIYVCPNRLFGVSDATGRFAIKDVPVGKYTAFTWHKNLPPGKESVEVTRLSVEKNHSISIKVDLGTLTEED